MVEVTQADREAAASGYYAWCSGNPVIPNRMIDGRADDHSMVQAFARHRLAEREAVVKWLNNAAHWLNDGACCGQKCSDGVCAAPACIWGDELKLLHNVADAIEAGEPFK